MAFGFTTGLLLIVLLPQGWTLLPQVSQEGLLKPFKSYADVTIFHYFVPPEVTRATFEFAAFMDSPDCTPKDVHIYIQHGSYPVMSADNSSFPEKMYTGRTSLYNLVVRSKFEPQDTKIFPVYNPLPGNWFAAAYLPDWDQQVQQEGIGHRCQYSLGSIALWTQVPTIDTIPIGTTSNFTRNNERFTYYKFYVPTDTWEFTVKIDGCKFVSSAYHDSDYYFKAAVDEPKGPLNNTLITKKEETCLQNVCMRARGLPMYTASECLGGVAVGKATSFTESLPVQDSYYYILLVANTKVTYNVTITSRVCELQGLDKNFMQQPVGTVASVNSKSQAVRTKHTNDTQVGDLVKTGCECAPIFRLTRIKHAQDFSGTFLLEGKEWFTTWLALSDERPVGVGVSFEILPFVDIGGTLTISLHMDELLLNVTSQELHVFACVRKSRAPEPLCCIEDPENILSCCEPGLSMHISSLNSSTVDDMILIPFPEPDLWYISFTTECFEKGKRVRCIVEDALVSLDVRTQPCVLTKPDRIPAGIRPCGVYGVCQEVHKGLFFYTSCRCLGGYRGWACQDDSHATPDRVLIMTTLLLTLSNLFFIPAIFLACYRKMFTHVLVYFSTMISSTLYHACDQDIYGYCVMRYQVLQFCDFFCSILAFWVTLVALARSPPKYDAVLYMLGAVVIAVVVEYNRTSLMAFVVPFCLGITIPFSVWAYRSIQTRAIVKPKLSSFLLFLPGVLLGGAGLMLFAFVETDDNYKYTHSAWHVTIAISLLYLLPKRRSKQEKLNQNQTLERNNTSELAAVSDYQPPSSGSPVFFITSDLDHLVHDQNR